MTVKFIVLASGSGGNAALLSTGKTRILIDAGLNVRDLAKRLASIGEDLERINAIVVTHEHGDHAEALPVLASGRKFYGTMHMTRGTAEAIKWQGEPRLKLFEAGEGFTVGDIKCETFMVPHDAADPVAFCFSANGARIGCMYDLGFVPSEATRVLAKTQVLLLECNYDDEIMSVSSYPDPVRKRVRSSLGHLSNDAAMEFVREFMSPDTKHLIAAHLSCENNSFDLVRLMAERAVRERGLNAEVSVASQSEVMRTISL
jgi:phosphoribosyl 1,2-cyclic phosphodiesterase